MRVIVMDKDMREPLTVVDIPASLMRDVENGNRSYITLAVPLTLDAWRAGVDLVPNAPETVTMKRVHLKMEKIVKGGSRGTPYEILFWTAIADDEELALLLRAAFLPGQVTELRRRELQQWFMGAVGAPPPSR